MGDFFQIVWPSHSILTLLWKGGRNDLLMFSCNLELMHSIIWFIIIHYLAEFFFLVMFLIVLIGIIGNASIIIIILRNKVLRLQPTNLFLLNMALSDFMNLCINPALHLFKSDVLFTNYYLGKVCCFLSPFLTGKSKLTLIQ